MRALLFFATLSLANFRPVHPIHLTREIQLACLPQPTPFDAFNEGISRTNVVQNLLDSVLESQLDTIIALQEKIASNSEDVPGILDELNRGAGARLFKVSDGWIQVDPDQLEQFAIDQSKTLSRILFPGDVFRQIIFFNAAKVQIKDVSANVAWKIASVRVPVSALAAILPRNDHQISKRAVDVTELLWSVVQTTVCQVVRPVLTVVNSAILEWQENLSDLGVERGDNPFVNFLADLIRTVITAATDVLENVRLAVAALFDAVCAGVSRRRRDVVSLQRSVTIFGIVGTILAFIWINLLAPIVNTAAKALISGVVAYLVNLIDSFLNTTFVDAANAVIDGFTNTTSVSA